MEKEFPPTFDEIFNVGISKGRYVEFSVFGISYYPVERQQERLQKILYGGEFHLQSKIYEDLDKKGFMIQRPNHVTISADNETTLDSKIIVFENSNKFYGELALKKLYNSENPQLRIFLLPDEILAPSKLEIDFFGGNEVRHTIGARDIHGSRLNIHCGKNPH